MTCGDECCAECNDHESLPAFVFPVCCICHNHPSTFAWPTAEGYRGHCDDCGAKHGKTRIVDLPGIQARWVDELRALGDR
jgi:hypothetical protein